MLQKTKQCHPVGQPENTVIERKKFFAGSFIIGGLMTRKVSFIGSTCMNERKHYSIPSDSSLLNSLRIVLQTFSTFQRAGVSCLGADLHKPNLKTKLLENSQLKLRDQKMIQAEDEKKRHCTLLDSVALPVLFLTRVQT